MSIPDERLRALIVAKDTDASLASCKEHGYNEGWAIRDGALVVYDLDNPPPWFPTYRQEPDPEPSVSGRVYYGLADAPSNETLPGSKLCTRCGMDVSGMQEHTCDPTPTPPTYS